MSTDRSPAYDRAHYSWQAPSSQASQSIIEHSPKPTSEVQPVDVTQDVETPPGLPRRSTFNYKHESDEHKKKISEEEQETGGVPDTAAEDTGGRLGSITSKPFKPIAKRTKSWDIRDLRGQLQMSSMREGAGEEPKDGFTEA